MKKKELRIQRFLKLVFDKFFSLFALIGFLPFFLLIGLFIKLDSKGPIFFIQERIGHNGKKFKMIKFRSMELGSQRKKMNLKKYNEVDSPMFKMKNDPRVTRFGKFLRKTGLDELPQLYNVLVGSMSVIGPRPPLEEEVACFKKRHLRKLSVKPGLSCTWQIQPNRHGIKFEEWVKMDLDYIDNWNLSKDVSIFFKTIKTVISAKDY